MSCLVVMLGFAVGLFALVIIVALIQSAFPAVLGGAIVEIILLPVFVLCLIKYYSNPKYKEKKQKKAKEEWAKRIEAEVNSEESRGEVEPKRIASPFRTAYKAIWIAIVACAIASVLVLVVGIALFTAEDSQYKNEKEVLEFLDDFTEYGYTHEEIEDMRTVLTNVGITEITDLKIQPVVEGMQVVKGLAYKDTSFLADANDEVQITFCIENGVIYLVAIYCPSYYSANRTPYLSGLTDRRADLYYDVEGGYLKKIDWDNKEVVDYYD